MPRKHHDGPLTFWVKIILQAVAVGLGVMLVTWLVTQFTGGGPPPSGRIAG